MEYAEIQSNEVEALKAIYASDFEELENKSVWNQKPSPKFSIWLRPSSEFEESRIKVQIQVTMTQTYPKTLPKVEITESNALSGRQLETLRHCIDQTLKELKGSEMIFEVTSNIQSQIDEWARSVSEAAPNLEEDRLRRLKLEERKQKEQQDAIQKEREDAAMQEEKKYDSLVLEELKRSELEDRRPSNEEYDLQQLTVVPPNTAGVTTFETPIELPQAFCDDNRNLVFRQVMEGLKIRQEFFGTSYLAKALLPNTSSTNDNSSNSSNSSSSSGSSGSGIGSSSSSNSDTVLLLNKIGLSSEYWRTAAGARKLHELNNELMLIKRFRHPGILPLCGFNMARFRGSAREWELALLTPLSRLTPLSAILDSTGTINLKTAQRWSYQILESLERLHKAGIRHRTICIENALVNVDPETGETCMMLRHPQYLYSLFILNQSHPFDEHPKLDILLPCLALKDSHWIPPEGRSHKPPAPGAKWDIWQFGALLTTMVAGKDELRNFHGDIESYVRTRPRHWPDDLTDFLLTVLQPDPMRRPGALELLTDQFFRSDFEVYTQEFDALTSLSGLNRQSPASTSTLSLGGPTNSLTPKAALSSRQRSNSIGMKDRDTRAEGVGPLGGGSFNRRRLSNNEDSSLFSRYKHDFDEGIVLGRGGFGQVVKARNKLDGRMYAVKKIRATPSTLSHILQEVVLLSRLNHQYVVRYYTVWLEDESESSDVFSNPAGGVRGSGDTASDATRSSATPVQLDSLLGTRSNGGAGDTGGLHEPDSEELMDAIPSVSLSKFSNHHSLSELDLASVSQDFMSDSGFVEFGFSDSDEDAVVEFGEEEDEDENDTNDGSKQQSRQQSGKSSKSVSKHARQLGRPRETLLNKLTKIAHKTLYIQMEYCENHTLGDLIHQGLFKNPHEYWRLFRQILEALAYIHGEGVIHRDLKPKNIFIDQARDVKIGDFGLARSVVQPLLSRQHSVDPVPQQQQHNQSHNQQQQQHHRHPTNQQNQQQHSNSDAPLDEEDLTTDVGTSLYSAIEITTSSCRKRGYNEKVDIFSLGIIFFEMIWGMNTEMERIQNIRSARMPQIELPSKLVESKDLRTQAELIRSMLNHDPARRPSASGLLESGIIPVEERNMTVQEALRNIRDPRIVQQLTNALFSRSLASAQQILYDRTNSSTISSRRQPIPGAESFRSLALTQVITSLTSVFRAHGAIDNTAFRSHLFPRAGVYKGPTVVEVLDSQGTVLQLPHDLTLPHARRLAEVIPDYSKAFAVDSVFRTKLQNPGIHPARHVEVDFDIISIEDSPESLIQDEAETIAVMYDSANSVLNAQQLSGDTASAASNTTTTTSANTSTAGWDRGSSDNLGGMAAENSAGLAVLIGHHDILSATLSYCGLNPPQFHAALAILNSGPLDRRENALMRSNVSTASLDMLGQFGFRETLARAESRMSRMMPLSERVRKALSHIEEVVNTFKRLCASDRDPEIYFSPLMHTGTSEFYINGVMFQLVDTKTPTTPRQFSWGSVLAVGGRYDSLIKSCRNSVLDSRTHLARAVGFGMSTDKLVAMLIKQQLHAQQSSQITAKPQISPRCQVLISSLSEAALNSQGLEAVRLLWRHGVKADVVHHIVSTEDLVAHAVKENATLVVIVKQMHSMSNVNSKFKPLRVKRISPSGSQSSSDMDLTLSELAPYILSELSMTGSATGLSIAAGSNSSSTDMDSSGYQRDSSPGFDLDSGNDRVIIINESGRLKGGRKNKWQLEEKSVEARSQLMQDLSNAPVISLDVRDEVIEAITTVSPHSPEDWKRRVVGLSPNQKAYIMTVQSKLSTEASRSPRMLLYSSKTGNIFVYNY